MRQHVLSDDLCEECRIVASLQAIFSGLVLDLKKYGIVLESLVGLGLLSLMVSMVSYGL